MTHVTQASDAFSDLRMFQADSLTMLPEPDVETAEDSYLMAATGGGRFEAAYCRAAGGDQAGDAAS